MSYTTFIGGVIVVAVVLFQTAMYQVECQDDIATAVHEWGASRAVSCGEARAIIRWNADRDAGEM